LNLEAAVTEARYRFLESQIDRAEAVTAMRQAALLYASGSMSLEELRQSLEATERANGDVDDKQLRLARAVRATLKDGEVI
jgi:hypothetical protein